MVAGPCTGAWQGYKCLVDRCARCGASLGEGDRFCGDCGAPVGGCPACGEPVIAGKRFCHACGHALAELAPASPARPRRRRWAAVAGGRWRSGGCARCCSATWWGSRRCRSRGIRRRSGSCCRGISTVARTVIGRYGGVVEKFIGDAVMAVWGTPVATEGDAERAVRAGLDLVAAVAAAGGRGRGAGAGGAGGGGDR